jgi:hypothetical protein
MNMTMKTTSNQGLFLQRQQQQQEEGKYRF